MSCTLKIVSVNDVYLLDNWPRIATAKKKCAEEGFHTIAVLPGDFVSPSVLSSLDKGYGMIDCMNEAGIDYVCMGNHENDIGQEALYQRIRESRFTWVNSNMQSMPLPPDIPRLPEYCVIEVQRDHGHEEEGEEMGKAEEVDDEQQKGDFSGGNMLKMKKRKLSHLEAGKGKGVRRVALLGLTTEDPAIKKENSFGGATIEPIADKAAELFDLITEREKRNGGIDAIIPMTHQLMEADRALTAVRDFRLIIGAHDHEVYNEEVNGCKIIKGGMDGVNVVVCTLHWENENSVAPLVTVSLEPSAKYEPDPKVARAVQKHQRVLVELDKSTLFTIPASLSVPFSSIGMRLRPTTVGTMFCSIARDELGADCTLVTAGSIRANRNYSDLTHNKENKFTYADLKKEVAYETPIVVLHLPGRVIVDMICYTRKFALQRPSLEKGCFLQTDDMIDWCRATNRVLSIRNAPVELDKMYRCGVNKEILSGLDDVQPLLRYRDSCTHDVLPHEGSTGLGLREMIVTHFSKQLLLSILQSNSFEDMTDSNKDYKLSKIDLRAIAARKLGEDMVDVSDLLVNNLFSICDLDGDGFINRKDILHFSAVALQSVLFKPSSGVDTLSLEEAAEEIASLHPISRNASIQSLLEVIDDDGSGFIGKEAFQLFLKNNPALYGSNVKI